MAMSDSSSIVSLSGDDTVEDEEDGDISGVIKRPRNAEVEDHTQTDVTNKRQKLHVRESLPRFCSLIKKIH